MDNLYIREFSLCLFLNSIVGGDPIYGSYTTCMKTYGGVKLFNCARDVLRKQNRLLRG